MNGEAIQEIQRETCKRFGAEFCPAAETDKLGIAQGSPVGQLPLNGLRHRPTQGTSGWYVWTGTELSDSPDFFSPLHVAHIDEWCPQIKKYLGLPPGWRFLISKDYEDVWFDPSLLAV